MDDRTKSIGSSDATRIWKGDWTDLWAEKVGKKEPEDLSGVFKVQLGVYTEPFHIKWLNEQLGYNIDLSQTDDGRQIKHLNTQYEIPMSASLDGIENNPVRRHVEVKHTNQFATLDELLGWYMPQLQHTMAVLSTEQCLFSYIGGNNAPSVHTIQRNNSFIEDLVKMEQDFWWHVETETEPDSPVSAAQGHTFVVDDMRPYNMTEQPCANQWLDHEVDFLENKEAAIKFERAKKGLKKLVPADCSRAIGRDVLIERSKSGSLLFK